jgi:hypothetical protein
VPTISITPIHFLGVTTGDKIYIGIGLLSVFLLSLSLSALNFGKEIKQGRWTISFIFGLYVSLFAPNSLMWLPVAVFIGCLAHILEDTLTSGGINYVYPFKITPPKPLQRIPIFNSIWMKNGRFALPICGKTGGVLEKILGAIFFCFGTIVIILSLKGINVNMPNINNDFFKQIINGK